MSKQTNNNQLGSKGRLKMPMLKDDFSLLGGYVWTSGLLAFHPDSLGVDKETGLHLAPVVQRACNSIQWTKMYSNRYILSAG